MSTTTAERVFEDHDYGTVRGLFDTALWAAKNGRAQDFLAHYRELSEHADANLGYVIGYGDEDIRRLMYEAFDLAHPALGGRPMTAPAEFVMFSDRYGIRREGDVWGREHWTGRHADHGIVSFGCCPPDPKRACACPGTSGKRQCCEVATAEDLLCDACREHCWAVDNAKVHHRLIDVYPAPTGRSTPTAKTPTTEGPNA